MRLLTLSLILLALLTTSHAHAQDAVAAPAVKVGDTWTYTRTDRLDRSRNATYRFLVRSVSPSTHTIAREVLEGSVRGADDEYTAELNPITLEGQKFAPHVPFFSFPLAPGKQWDGRYTFYTNVELSGQRSSKVEGWETIRVPAGEFKALRITATTSTRAPNGFGSSAQQTLWYAPDVRRMVRMETKIFGGANARDEVAELVSYSLVD